MKNLGFVLLLILFAACESDVTSYATNSAISKTSETTQLQSDSVLVNVVPNGRYLAGVKAYNLRVDWGDGFAYQPEVDALYRGPGQEYHLQFWLQKSKILNDYAIVQLNVLKNNEPHGYLEEEVVRFYISKE